MKKITFYLLLLSLVWLVPTKSTLAQDFFKCELDFNLTPVIGVCGTSLGSINVSISGGFGPYEVWVGSNSNGVSKIEVTNSTNLLLDNLPTGAYTVVLTDQFSKCREIKQAEVGFNFLQATVAVEGNPARCNGKGSLSINIIGETPPYNLTVKGPSFSSRSANSNNFRIFNLTSGEYEVIIEKNGCSTTVRGTVGTSPGLPSLEIIAEKDACGIHTGIANAVIQDGRPDYTLSWQGPTSGSISTTSDAKITGLKTGTYRFTLVDAMGCQAVSVLDLNVTPLSISAQGFAETERRNGFIKVRITGGIPDYTIAWTGPESGSRKARALTESLSLLSGDYTIEITDKNGCKATAKATISSNKFSSGVNVPNAKNVLESATVSLEASTPFVHQNYPNPFDNQTNIRFELPSEMKVSITIQNRLGQIITSNKGQYTKGLNHYTFSHNNLNSGIYFYTIEAEGFKETKRMIVK